MRYIAEDCLYTEGVTCDKPAHCYKCGWNPKVAAERLKRIKNGDTETVAEELP